MLLSLNSQQSTHSSQFSRNEKLHIVLNEVDRTLNREIQKKKSRKWISPKWNKVVLFARIQICIQKYLFINLKWTNTAKRNILDESNVVLDFELSTINSGSPWAKILFNVAKQLRKALLIKIGIQFFLFVQSFSAFSLSHLIFLLLIYFLSFSLWTPLVISFF